MKMIISCEEPLCCELLEGMAWAIGTVERVDYSIRTLTESVAPDVLCLLIQCNYPYGIAPTLIDAVARKTREQLSHLHILSPYVRDGHCDRQLRDVRFTALPTDLNALINKLFKTPDL